MTVNRAVRELTAERVLIRTRGSGTFVAPPKHEATLVEIRSIADEIRAGGHVHSADVLGSRPGSWPARTAPGRELGLGAAPGSSTPSCSTARTARRSSSRSAGWCRRWPPATSSRTSAALTPSEYLLRVAPLARVEYRIEALRPTPAVRAALRLGAGEPCLLLHRRTTSGGRPASVADLWHPGSRYRLTGHF